MAPRAAPSSPIAVPVKTTTIAVIEPDGLNSALLQRWLQETGHRVRIDTPTSLRPADRVDLVIASVDSPRQAADYVRALQTASTAPLLLTSARFVQRPADPDELARQMGVRAVLAKPYDRGELLAAVARALG
jgi:CheY-like chemotaxis protein